MHGKIAMPCMFSRRSGRVLDGDDASMQYILIQDYLCGLARPPHSCSTKMAPLQLALGVKRFWYQSRQGSLYVVADNVRGLVLIMCIPAGALASSTAAGEVQLIEGRLSWLVHIIGAIIQGRMSSNLGESQVRPATAAAGDPGWQCHGLRSLLGC